jgi:glucose-6-phosphate isomerase
VSDPIPTRLPAWAKLAGMAPRMLRTPLADLTADPARFDRLCFRMGELTIDFSKQRIDDEVFAAMLQLAGEADLKPAIERLVAGGIVNTTEQRAALHTALRAPLAERPASVRDEVERELQRVFELARALHVGDWRGHTGRPIRDIVHIGIGGSHLGPAFALEALSHLANHRFRIHFLTNVDAHLLTALLPQLDPETTLFVIVSKSFSTVETRVNGETARSWFLERSCSREALARHFIAVSSNVDAAVAFGIDRQNIFSMWDWVGGRYSLWSAVGLPVLLALGADGFLDLLRGAHEVDRHLAQAPLSENVPALLALVGIWNTNFLGAETHAVLCYDHRLRSLTDYLQQLETESNGKSTRLDGGRSEIHTGPVLWGGEEPLGQHSFHQLLHQGTREFSVDFVTCIEPDHAHEEHHRWLLASCLSQGEAFVQGRPADTLGGDPLAAHKAIRGNRPSTTILLDALTPSALGALLALYEHKVYCQSVIWHINAFDQWGVELGKMLGQRLHSELGGGTRGSHDSSTDGLITTILKHRRT